MKRTPYALAIVRFAAALAAGLLPCAAALAHPGHGHTDPHSPTHYVFEPAHALGLAAVALLGVGFVLLVRRLMQRRSR